MSLTDAFLLEPYPFEIWIASRTDGVKGSGTASDPYDGGPVLATAKSVTVSRVGTLATGKPVDTVIDASRRDDSSVGGSQEIKSRPEGIGLYSSIPKVRAILEINFRIGRRQDFPCTFAQHMVEAECCDQRNCILTRRTPPSTN